MSNTLCDILSRTLSLLSQKLCEGLLDGDKPTVICQKLESALGEYERKFDDADLNRAIVFLRTSVADLEICFESLEETNEPGTSLDDNPNGDQSYGSKLERELRKINSGNSKAKEKFLSASNNFQKANRECSRICQNIEDPSLGLQKQLTPTKVRVIAEILGNLADLNVAAENCIRIISELHKCRKIQRLFNAVAVQPLTQTKFKRFVNNLTIIESEESKNLTSLIKINLTVFTFEKKCIRKPEAIIDWPVVKEEEKPQTFHPIIGRPPNMKIYNRSMQSIPDLSTSIESNEMEIDTNISTVNCKGEVLAKHKTISSAIVKISSDGKSSMFWSLPDEKARELKIEGNVLITSISLDSNDCTLLRNRDDPHEDCKNKLFVLAKYTSEQQSDFVLFVLDMHGNLLYTVKPTFLPRRNISEKVCTKVLCTKDKLILFDVHRHKVYLCDKNGELEDPKNAGRWKPKLMASAVSDMDAILVSDKLNEVHFYEISEKHIRLVHVFKPGCDVRAVSYNHALNEVNVLCKSGSVFAKRYHLMRYEKTGTLKQDIELQNDLFDFSCASLVSHPSGPVVLFDNNKLLYLQ